MRNFAARILITAASLAIASGLFSAIHATNAAGSPRQQADSSAAAWNALVDAYFDQGYYKFKPTIGTVDGFHKYDSRLEGYSRAGITEEISTLRRYEKRFLAVDSKVLDPVAAADRELILSNIHGRLLTLETIRPWEKNPDLDSSGITEAAYVVMERRFAPPDQPSLP